MILYPLRLLKRIGIENILVVTGREHMGQIISRLGDGRVFYRDRRQMIEFDRVYYTAQRETQWQGYSCYGIAQAIQSAQMIANGRPIAVILGDNIFEFAPQTAFQKFQERPDQAQIFLTEVDNPSDYGVAEIGAENQVLSLEEKPERPRSNLTITGFYLFPADVFSVIDWLLPKPRLNDQGELHHYEYEVTDINAAYLEKERLQAHIIPGWWGDAGQDNPHWMKNIPDNLRELSNGNFQLLPKPI
jgi:glucose-1-phosphate thymidylyltransferase